MTTLALLFAATLAHASTDTFTETATSTSTASLTPTATSTATRTSSGTSTPTLCRTPSITLTFTRSKTPSGTPSPSRTATPTLTGSVTRTSTRTASRTATRSATSTSSTTRTPSGTATVTFTRTPTPIAGGPCIDSEQQSLCTIKNLQLTWVALQQTAAAGGGSNAVMFGLRTTASPSYFTPVANQTPLIVWSGAATGWQGGSIQNLGSTAISIIYGGTPVAGNGQSLGAGQTYDLNAYEVSLSLGIVTASGSSAFYARRNPAP